VARGRQALLANALPEAETLLRRTWALHTRHPNAYLTLALVYVKRRKYARALRYFQHPLHAHPAFPHVRFNLSVSLYHFAHYAEAMKHFAYVVTGEPMVIEAAFNLVNSLAQTGQHGAAIQWCQRTLTLAPGHGLARTNLQALPVWYTSQP
jgi:tetratricopeptide (TPR) repeat protein